MDVNFHECVHFTHSLFKKGGLYQLRLSPFLATLHFRPFMLSPKILVIDSKERSQRD